MALSCSPQESAQSCTAAGLKRSAECRLQTAFADLPLDITIYIQGRGRKQGRLYLEVIQVIQVIQVGMATKYKSQTVSN